MLVEQLRQRRSELNQLGYSCLARERNPEVISLQSKLAPLQSKASRLHASGDGEISTSVSSGEEKKDPKSGQGHGGSQAAASDTIDDPIRDASANNPIRDAALKSEED